MAAPEDADLKYYLGANGTPTNDTGDIGGAIDTDPELDEATDDLLFGPAAAEAFSGGSNVVHRAVAYRKLEEGAGGKFLDPLQVYIGNGAILNASGTITYTAGAADAGKKVRTVGVSTTPVAPLTTLVTGDATTGTSYDANLCIRHELAESDGETPAVCEGAEIVIKRGSTVLGRFRPGDAVVTAEYELALATSKNATLSAADRLTDPASISSYTRPIRVSSQSVDTAVSVPGGDFEDGDYIGFVLKRTLYKGCAPPLRGFVDPDIVFEGDASA